MTFNQRLVINCPKSLPAAVDRAAEKKLTTRSEYARQAIFEKLRADGVDLSELTGAAA